MAAKTQSARARAARQAEEVKVQDSVKDLSLESVSKSIAETQVEVQKVLATLSASVMARLDDLRNVEEAIKLKNERLVELTNMEAAALKLDEMETKMEEQKKNWAEEERQRTALLAEQNADRLKQWKREEEDYKYTTAQKARAEADTMAYQKKQQEQANRERQDQLNKQWAEREAELKKAEQELAELRKLKEDLPEMLKKEGNNQAQAAGRSVAKEYETKMVLAAKDAEVEKKLLEQAKVAADATNAKLQEQIADLKRQLEQAHAAARETSKQAFESVSGRSTTEALQRIMEKEQGSKTTK